MRALHEQSVLASVVSTHFLLYCLRTAPTRSSHKGEYNLDMFWEQRQSDVQLDNCICHGFTCLGQRETCHVQVKRCITETGGAYILAMRAFPVVD